MSGPAGVVIRGILLTGPEAARVDFEELQQRAGQDLIWEAPISHTYEQPGDGRMVVIVGVPTGISYCHDFGVFQIDRSEDNLVLLDSRTGRVARRYCPEVSDSEIVRRLRKYGFSCSGSHALGSHHALGTYIVLYDTTG